MCVCLIFFRANCANLLIIIFKLKVLIVIVIVRNLLIACCYGYRRIWCMGNDREERERVG